MKADKLFILKTLILATLVMLIIVEMKFRFTAKYSRAIRTKLNTIVQWKNDNSDTSDRTDNFVRWKRVNYTSNRTNNSELIAKNKLILLYTPVFGKMPWIGLENSQQFLKPCGKIRNCELTYDKSRIKQSDAVVFHGRDMPSSEMMARIPRNKRQRWIFFSHENPAYTLPNPALYNNVFNWTMSYHRDSEFFMPYDYYYRLQPEEAKLAKPKNYSKGKDKFIAWIVSNCGRLRDQVVTKLSQYVKVTVFGSCSSKFGQNNHCARKSSDCERLLRRFKFYLSFENMMCTDYVTEKYWHTPFVHDMVPIVLGGSNYDHRVAIPGSYINVLDFPSIQALAQYLEYLNTNDTAYNEYFQWKTQFKLGYPQSMIWNCNLCTALHNATLPDKVYNLGIFWGVESSCTRHEEKVRKLLQIK